MRLNSGALLRRGLNATHIPRGSRSGVVRLPDVVARTCLAGCLTVARARGPGTSASPDSGGRLPLAFTLGLAMGAALLFSAHDGVAARRRPPAREGRRRYRPDGSCRAIPCLRSLPLDSGRSATATAATARSSGCWWRRADAARLHHLTHSRRLAAVRTVALSAVSSGVQSIRAERLLQWNRRRTPRGTESVSSSTRPTAPGAKPPSIEPSTR